MLPALCLGVFGIADVHWRFGQWNVLIFAIESAFEGCAEHPDNLGSLSNTLKIVQQLVRDGSKYVDCRFAVIMLRNTRHVRVSLNMRFLVCRNFHIDKNVADKFIKMEMFVVLLLVCYSHFLAV